jgi:hypothetical protein
MSEPRDAAPEDAPSYVRGGAGLPTSTGRVLRVVLATIVLSLVGVTIGLGIEAAHHQSRTQRLHDHGVPVSITVTGCLGLVSGTGITPSTYICHGSFTLDGRSYDESIHDSPNLLKVGHHVAGVDDAGTPSDLTLAGSVGSAQSTWQIYANTIWLAIASLVVAGIGVLLLRRAPRAPAALTVAPPSVATPAPLPVAVAPTAPPTDAVPVAVSVAADTATDATTVAAVVASRRPDPRWAIPAVGAVIVGVALLVRARRSS